MNYSWYLAPSLVTLRGELDGRWPHRGRESDGTIGDAAHRKRPSDHNPDDTSTPPGVVRAFDITTDGSIDASLILHCLMQHPATHYVIYRDTIYDRSYSFRPRDYRKIVPNGDSHDNHIHISILHGRENATDHWLAATNLPEVDDMPYSEDQLKTIFDTALRDTMPSIVQAACDRAAENAVNGILHGMIKTMNPADGSVQEIPLTTALGRAAEATIIRQAEHINSADDTPRTQLPTDTATLKALMAGAPDDVQDEVLKLARGFGPKSKTKDAS